MKSVSKLMLAVAVMMMGLSPVTPLSSVSQLQAQTTSDANAVARTEDGARIFNYHLKMENVDTANGARAYPSDTRNGSLIGFNGHYTATKRMPYKVGPGKVRVYLHAYPEGDEKTLSVTLGDQTKSATHSRKVARYSWHELVFDLKKPEDMLQFEAKSVDGKKARVIWYSTIVTNDPALHYTEVAKNKFKILRKTPGYTNPGGNLVPNSSFEAGIQGWDITPYKSNIMAKPSLLSKQAAHYQHGMDVGKIRVTSRWFPLEKGQSYNFSFYVAADNKVPVEALIETQAPGSKLEKIVEVTSENAEDSQQNGWKRMAVTFNVPAKTEDDQDNDDDVAESSEGSTAGQFRVIFRANGSDTPVLVDSVQITQGESLEPYALNQGIEANVISPATQGIYLLGASGDMYFNLASEADVTIQKISYEVTDYFDRQVVAPTTLTIAKSGQVPVKLSTDHAGMFRVRTHIAYTKAGQSNTLVKEFFYHVVHPSSPRTDRLAWSQLGGYFTSAPKGPYSYAEVANRFGIYEFNTLGHQMGRWKANMKRDPKDRKKYLRKQYDFSASEKELAQFAKNNINTFVNFHVNAGGGSYGVPFGQDPKTPGPVFEFKKKVTFLQDDWLHFVEAYVTHFKGRVKRYEVQDEPYQYFNADQYAEFYLATYKAIKKADPDALVYIHNAQGKMDYLNSLNKITDNKAHEYMDGVYVYLTQQHSGRISRTAVPEFRAWAKKHNLPIFTATCFSAGKDFARHSLDQAPDYLPEREDEVRSIQHFFDGLIWGQAQAFYYYYGSHPGGSYASLFDQYGQIIPMIHFYSAANALVGDHTNVVSVESIDELRIGVVETQRNKTYAILYSVDGKLYNLSADADTFTQSLDGFGNPTRLQKADGKINLVVGPHPVYLLAKDANAAIASLKAASIKETVDVELTYAKADDGGLLLRTLIHSDLPLEGWTDTKNVFRRDVVGAAHTKEVDKQLYELRIPLAVSQVNTLNNSYYLKLSSNLGDAYASYKNTYAPLLPGKPEIDGKYASDEWPIRVSQTIPLGGYYLYKGDQAQKKENTRGQAALMYDKQNLYGLLTLYKASKDYSVTLEIAPRNPVTGKVVESQITRITLNAKTASVNGQESSDIQNIRVVVKDANEVKQHQATDLIEFSIPLASIPGFKISDGTTYGLRVLANDTPLPEDRKDKMPSWYLDAQWPALNDLNAPDAEPTWGTLMVVE